MQTPQSIVAIANDDALLRSLAFALGVEGYAVQSCGSWQAARELIPLSACVIVDVDICRKDADARDALLKPENRIVLLTDGMPQPNVAATIRLIPKPLDGSDIVEGVRHFHRART
ncbi:MAG TPA: transcriptional regulator [Pararhizobium sp.]|uniref:transcriptional regulator n=1 Tax=Pararhizobium sp. TaxID=1977563 RepID=UPI002B668899|nr:transcriptional regulator [Pararhizobium sp.]HTO30575.1 transcriptional regulator [Pararhizobium sp.]